ncbi:MAG: hypothetical protein ABSB23_03070 [Bryobacteraceae bacterium]|jgi:hypothetical protein
MSNRLQVLIPRGQGGGACTSTEALREILYRYASLGHLDLAGQVHDLLADICPVVPAATVADTAGARNSRQFWLGSGAGFW